jgi:hypothetical protein
VLPLKSGVFRQAALKAELFEVYQDGPMSMEPSWPSILSVQIPGGELPNGLLRIDLSELRFLD